MKSMPPFNHLADKPYFFQLALVAIRLLLVVFISLLPFQHILSQTHTNPLLAQGGSDTEPARNIIASNEKFCEVEYLFNGFTASEKEQDGKTYHYLHVDGFGKMTEVGKPALPSHTDIFALAKGKKIEIEVIDAVFKDYQGMMVHPTLSPASDEVGAPEPVFKIDEEQYLKDEFFPANNIVQSNTYFLRGLPLALVDIRPMQFNPVTQTVRVYSRIRYKIIFKGSSDNTEGLTSNSSQGFIAYAKNLVLNNNLIADKGKAGKQSSGSKDYIIITHPDYRAAADSLAKWKMQLGLDVEIVEKPNWTSAEIKDSVNTRYNNWSPKPDYVAFLGDVDKVPGELIDGSFACDLYYVCMDGAGDYFADMAGGRISVNSGAEALMVVKKMINYERQPVSDTAFYRAGLNCAQFQDYDTDTYADRRFSLTSENIFDYMSSSQGYSVNRVYVTGTNDDPQFWNNGYYAGGEPLPSYLLKPGFTWDGDAADIINEINAGKLYVLHRDHGYTGGWGDPAFSVSDIPALNNGDQQPVMFSINCSSGNFRATSFAETMLRKENGGSVGVFAASDVSYSGYNDAMAIGFFDAIWSQPGMAPNFTGSGWTTNPSLTPHTDISNMGFVLMQGLLRMTETWGGFQVSHELFHYHGDPSMRIWTEVPEPITATHPGNIVCNGTTYSISSCSYADGMATLYHNGELIGSTLLSGGAGTITFDPVTNIAPYATLTISGRNYAPYTYDVAITGCTFPPIAHFITSDTNTVFCGSSTETITLTDLSTYGADNWDWTITPSTVSFVNGTNSNSQHPEVQFNAPGNYTVSLLVSNSFGYDAYYLADIIAVNSGSVIPFVEDFETNSFPPEGWSIENPDGSITWNSNTSAVGNANSTASAYLNYFAYSDVGQQDGLISPILDLVNVADATFSFDLAYAQFSTFVDTLAVYVSTDCGATYDPAPIYMKYGNQLETVSSGGSYTPTALSEWRRETADLTPYAGNQVVVKILGTNGYGNNLFLDNINVYSSSTLPAVEFTATDTFLSCEGTNETVTFYDLSMFNPTAWIWSFSPSTVSFVNGTNANSQNPQVQFNDYGTYSVTLDVGNNAGSEYLAKQDYIVVEVGATIPFEEGFESQSVPPGVWQLVNPDNDKTWDISLTATGNGSGLASAYMYNYAYYAPGEIDELVSPPIDLNGLADASLSFNVAYRMYSSAYSDSLKIFVSTDCGDSYELSPVYAKGGTSLETSPGSGSSFTPSQAGDWRNEVVDLSSYVGSSIVVKFQAINDYGNNLFLDDINLSSTGMAPIADFNSSLPDMLGCSGVSETIDLYSACSNNPTSWIWQITPSSFSFVNGTNSFSENPQVQFASLGTYDVQLTAINANGSHSVNKTIVIDEVEAGFYLPNDTLYVGVPVTMNNTGSGSNAWSWNFGDGISSNLENLSYTYSDTGHFTISQVVQNTVTGCMDSMFQDVVVQPFTSGIEPIGWENIRVVPVPSDGLFSIDFNQSMPGMVWVRIYNLVGQEIYRDEVYVGSPISHPIDISKHPKGLYMVRINSESIGPAGDSRQRSFLMIIE